MSDSSVAADVTLSKYSHKIKCLKIEYVPLLFLIAIIAFYPFSSSGSENTLAIVFISIVLEAIPFMLVGSLVGGFIESFISRERMVAILPKRSWITVFAAAAAGMVFPVCECAVVPVVRRLTGKGLPFSAAIAYLLGGPIFNPIVGASTAMAYAFNWKVVVLRLGFGYLIAVIVGLIMGKLFSRSQALKDERGKVDASKSTSSCSCNHSQSHGHQNEHEECCGNDSHGHSHSENCGCEHEHPDECGCGHDHSHSKGFSGKVKDALLHAMDDFLAVGQYLIIGAFIAALAQTYINRSEYLSFAGAPVISIVLMMFLAVMLNLCSEADAFIASSFQGIIPLPAQIAFLLMGPMFDLKLLLMYNTVFTRRVIVVLSLIIAAIVFAFAAGLIFIL